jgi:hypothetical protein
MRLPRITCRSDGTIGRWHYHQDWRLSLAGLVLALAVIAVGVHARWVDGAQALAMVIIASTATSWRRATPPATPPDDDHPGQRPPMHPPRQHPPGRA